MGTLDRFNMKYFPEIDYCLVKNYDNRSKLPVLTLKDLAGIFLILPIGYLLGVLVMICEVSVPPIKNETSKRMRRNPLITSHTVPILSVSKLKITFVLGSHGTSKSSIKTVTTYR